MQLILGKKAVLDAAKNKILKKAIVSNKDKVFFNEIKKYFPNVEINNDKQFYDNQTNNYSHHQFALGWTNNENKTILTLDNFINKNNSKKNLTVLILDEINDPGNFGAIIRTSCCFGIDAIIYKKNNQVKITPVVIKASIGAISHVNLIEVANLNDTIQKLKDAGFWIYASCLDKEALSLSDVSFYEKSAIIVGNEKDGISKLLIKDSDFKVYIPMTSDKIQSLNVSVATGILLYARNQIKK